MSAIYFEAIKSRALFAVVRCSRGVHNRGHSEVEAEESKGSTAKSASVGGQGDHDLGIGQPPASTGGGLEGGDNKGGTVDNK